MTESRGPEAFDHLPADHPAPITWPSAEQVQELWERTPLQEWEVELLCPPNRALLAAMVATGNVNPVHEAQFRAYLDATGERWPENPTGVLEPVVLPEPMTLQQVVEPVTAKLGRPGRQPVTTIRSIKTGTHGTLVRIDSAGNPVVRFFGDHTEYPYRWDQLEVLASGEYDMVPGAFEIGLFVDGDGDLWRELGDCADPDSDGPTYRMVSCQGRPASGRSELSREDIIDFTGALEPAGSPEAQRIRDYTSSDVDTSPLVAALVAGFLVIALVCVAVWLIRWGLTA